MVTGLEVATLGGGVGAGAFAGGAIGSAVPVVGTLLGAGIGGLVGGLGAYIYSWKARSNDIVQTQIQTQLVKAQTEQQKVLISSTPEKIAQVTGQSWVYYAQKYAIPLIFLGVASYYLFMRGQE